MRSAESLMKSVRQEIRIRIDQYGADCRIWLDTPQSTPGEFDGMTHHVSGRLEAIRMRH